MRYTHSISLFMRTFWVLLLMIVLFGLLWIAAFFTFEVQPHSEKTAQQISSLVTLSRAAIVHSNAEDRLSLLLELAKENITIAPKEANDEIEILPNSIIYMPLEQILKKRLGENTVVAKSVNTDEGLWVSFDIQGDLYWLKTDLERVYSFEISTWVILIASVLLFCLLGSVIVTEFVNRPLKQLIRASKRLERGDFNSAKLNENVVTQEVAELNRAFNQMTHTLSLVEKERTLLLAGISHDLRTPLTRLRLETELSVSEPSAREGMIDDLDLINQMLNKFLEYARDDPLQLESVNLYSVVTESLGQLSPQTRQNMQVDIQIDPHLYAQGNTFELKRICVNLFENAYRYGKTPHADYVELTISASESAHMPHAKNSTFNQHAMVTLAFKDKGSGVAPHLLEQLTRPFFRADNARGQALGSGLGLAIIEKTVQKMHGQLILENVTPHGLAVYVCLQK